MSDIKRLLFVTHNFPPVQGGISVFSQELCRNFMCHGTDVKVLTNRSDPTPRSSEFDVIYSREYTLLGKLRRVAIKKPLAKILLEWKPDVIFLASVHPYGIFVENAARKHGIPYVVGSHGSDINRLVDSNGKNKLGRWIGRKTLEGSQAIFSVSGYIAEQVKRVAPSAIPPTIVPNGVDVNLFSMGVSDLEKWSKRAGIELRDKFVICSVSSLYSHKGHANVIRAFAQLTKRVSNLVYLIAGSGPEENKLKSLVKMHHVSEQVAFLGHLEHSDVPDLLRVSDLFILNCRSKPGEGFGIVFLEANACGLPVIAGNTGGVPDAVKDGETGFLVDPEDPAAIASAIEKLYADEALRRKLGKRGRIWAEEHDWSKIVPRYLDVMRDCIR
ncbi:hypothetical protein CEE37_09680 [candidate division LCP-89 bacterium B3_LCP]|uniref:Uncharacterized protein n=1 Tax=candidate division LCP-89 bacterium B3_LCP TaxID=2012998 RepID=A0A532UYJ8_UNCL8|nr:MAG: hypothetical protein CEE37_09680 [candidate division LCP-89 bacterium B3_LCP]